MQRLFFRNLAFIISLNVLIKPLWILGIDRTVQNVVGPQDYGAYFVLFNLSLLTQILLDIGISNYNNRFIAQQENQLNTYISNIFSIKVILAVVYLVISLTIGWALNFTGYRLMLLLSICFNQLLASFIVYVRSNISALHHFKTDSILSILDKAIMIIICGGLLWIPVYRVHFKIEWFVYAQTISYLISLLTSVLILLRFAGKINFTFSFTFTLRLLRNTFPFALLIMLMAIYSRIDGVMIEKLSPGNSIKEAGIYASAFRLLDVLNQFGYLFAVLLLPIFSRMIIKSQHVEELVKTSFTVIFITSVITACTFSTFSREIMNSLYHEGSVYSAKILSILIFSFIGTCSVFIFGTLLTANGNIKELILISLFGVIVNYTLNQILIRKYQALGAAEASAISNLLIAFFNLLLSVIIFKWKPNYFLIARLSAFAVTTFFIFQLSFFQSVNWLVHALIAVMVSTIIAFLLQLVSIKKMLQLFPGNIT
ncbi:MAG: oligosaccharide flippase family protein [Chitinophagales bacterium]|nr:oligosaccharide flippase family protein [Chitinophagales bacterium]